MEFHKKQKKKHGTEETAVALGREKAEKCITDYIHQGRDLRNVLQGK